MKSLKELKLDPPGNLKAMELARRILDELMGADRNKMPNEKGSFGVKFYDSQVKLDMFILVCD